jgi:hypothetical protein
MLLPISTFEREAVGIFQLQNTYVGSVGTPLVVEGGYIGQVIKGTGGQHLQPVVSLYNNATDEGGYGSSSDLSLVGLIDESSTGTKNSGTGNTGFLGKTLPSFQTGSNVGPSSAFGSGKCTLWMSSGLFVTDQFDHTISIANGVPVGQALYSSNGILSTTVGGAQVGTYIEMFTGGLANITSATRDLLGVLPRVQSLPTATTLLLFKFK